MYTTSFTLLTRIRQPRDQQAWNRFAALYTPLLYHWARRAGLQQHDCADLVQDVLTILVRKMPEFQYNRRQSFRSWLRTLTMNKWRDHSRRRQVRGHETTAPDFVEVAVADDSFEETEYRCYLVKRALELMQREFQPVTWRACWEYLVNSKAPAEVAAELGVTVDVVYSAKSRVLRRLREELSGLLD